MTCRHKGCTDNAVFDTGRCIVHAEPVTRNTCTGPHTPYSGTYVGSYPVGTFQPDSDIAGPVIHARPYTAPVQPLRRGWLTRALERLFRGEEEDQ